MPFTWVCLWFRGLFSVTVNISLGFALIIWLLWISQVALLFMGLSVISLSLNCEVVFSFGVCGWLSVSVGLSRKSLFSYEFVNCHPLFCVCIMEQQSRCVLWLSVEVMWWCGVETESLICLILLLPLSPASSPSSHLSSYLLDLSLTFVARSRPDLGFCG